jgi:hypothetical protein
MDPNRSKQTTGYILELFYSSTSSVLVSRDPIQPQKVTLYVLQAQEETNDHFT